MQPHRTPERTALRAVTQPRRPTRLMPTRTPCADRGSDRMVRRHSLSAAVLGEEQLLQRGLPAQQLRDPGSARTLRAARSVPSPGNEP